ncbi:MAG: caspase family protein [Dinghuibacter sp.]|nr:caspase family protein [Dinghuibacter sp.]
MAKGLSLHVGINFSDKKHYGSIMKLKWCANDALSMSGLAFHLGYATYQLYNEHATSAMVCNFIRMASRLLNAGDIFLFSYSGHGTQVIDTNVEERDGKDEAWVFYDRMLIDDEMLWLWSEFDEGVRIVTVSDCCHSGAVIDPAEYQRYKTGRTPTRPKTFLPDYSNLVISGNQPKYTDMFAHMLDKGRPEIKASVLQLYACQPREKAMEYDEYRHGVFTYSLLNTFDAGKFTDYDTFLNQLKSGLCGTTQTPSMCTIGKNVHLLNSQMPFVI